MLEIEVNTGTSHIRSLSVIAFCKTRTHTHYTLIAEYDIISKYKKMFKLYLVNCQHVWLLPIIEMPQIDPLLPKGHGITTAIK